jgi:hypothetical protein
MKVKRKPAQQRRALYLQQGAPQACPSNSIIGNIEADVDIANISLATAFDMRALTKGRIFLKQEIGPDALTLSIMQVWR